MSKYIASRDQCGHHVIFPGVAIHTLPGQQIMLSLVEFEPGSVVEWHSHPHEQMGLLLEGELEFFIDDEHHVVRAGQMWRIPGGIRHRVIAGDKPAKALDVFCPIREDYL
jgi:quercetin dioxygenase-like cupin family protein